ncbi:hypothetical protein M2102_000274 [Fusobacterium sp. PH5-7]|uniref:autotransporter family protein n=1 Tax=Fusobacterium sp. PH5-7 TaxID=2940528 RepID=UPI002474B31E|nr:autotransporter outer membrane beta-barrel domain-containing protein [Fusobacterium sp. PH5-7]MDH6456661.1 hypothetical protein [Fusobacterium sp. PH5-7]
MIEKIMKAVKSGNKKRGRNITVGAVVGMLLSCTSVMGADVVGLEITKDTSDEIKFSKDYTENTWDEESNTYTNNSRISVENNNDSVYGLKLSGDLSEASFITNGSISVTVSERGTGYGIYNEAGNIGSIINTGSIFGNTKGIYNLNSSTIGEIINSGSIISIGNNGIYNNKSSRVGSIINSGTISSGMNGIYNYDFNGTGSSIGEIINSGTISANAGIANADSSNSIESLTNRGIIYGQDVTIVSSGGTISNAFNYGLLVSGNSFKSVIKGVTIVDSSTSTLNDNEIKNYGLAFTVDSSTNEYIGGGSDSGSPVDYHNNFGEIHQISIDGVSYDIINVDAEVNETSKEITDWKSLSMKDGKLYSDADDIANSEISDFSSDKKYILNGIEDTLKISGRKNELNNSVVNAYKTAVVMDQGMSMLTLDNTVVNGGVADDSTAISITEDGSTLTLKGDSIINSADTAIMITGNNNAVTLEGNAIVNGKMESKGNNILNLYGKADGSMNMLHDISGFTDISIDNNVTFFEDMKVTGTNVVTVEKTGVLSLRLTKEKATVTAAIASSTPIPIATHAFSGTDGMTIEGISPEEAGTLNFITNGIGRVIDVDMTNIALKNMKIKASSIIDKAEIHEDYIRLGAGSDLDGIVNPKVNKYNSLNKIYKSIYNSTDEKNLDGLRDILGMTFLGKNYDYNSSSEEDQLKILLSYLNDIYTGTPYSYSSELSRKSMGMFRDIVTENEFRPNQDKWLIMGGLTHADGGTKDTYYGQNYHEIDGGTAETSADMKLTGAYMLAKYGYSENLSLGVTLGGNKSEAEMSMAKVKGNSGYLGAFAENYRGNLTLKAGAGVQYSEYDADRRTLGNAYNDKYSDMTYDIYLNGRYSHQVGDNLFLEPYATLSYTYVDQDGANEGNKTLAIETDSKSFDYTVGKVGVDLKKVIPHEKGKSTLTAGVSYTKIFDEADEEHITGRFKGGSDFDILVAHKNEHSVGVNAKYALELENGVIFDVKGSYSVERDSHNGSGKNRTKGEWIVGAGLGYKF